MTLPQTVYFSISYFGYKLTQPTVQPIYIAGHCLSLLLDLGGKKIWIIGKSKKTKTYLRLALFLQHSWFETTNLNSVPHCFQHHI